MGCAPSHPEGYVEPGSPPSTPQKKRPEPTSPPRSKKNMLSGGQSRKNLTPNKSAQAIDLTDFFEQIASKSQYTEPANLKEFVRVPASTQLAYEFEGVTAKQREQIAKLPPSPFSESRVGLRTLKGMNGREKDKDGHDKPRAPKMENQDCLMLTRLEYGTKPELAVCVGVYDGHGVMGRVMSHVVARHVAAAVKDKEDYLENGASATSTLLRQIMLEADQKTETEVYPDAYKKSGSTASVCVITDLNMVVGTLGDSRCLKLSSSDGKPWAVTTATTCHKVDDPVEMARIVAAGGKEAILPPPAGEEKQPTRVQVKDGTTGSMLALAMSRAFGDGLFKPVGVTAEPEMLSVPITPTDRCVVLGCDGVFDYLSDEEVCEIAWTYRYSATAAAKAIEAVAATRQDTTDDGYRDDTTCAVVFLPLADRSMDGGNAGFGAAKSVREIQNDVDVAIKRWVPNAEVKKQRVTIRDFSA